MPYHDETKATLDKPQTLLGLTKPMWFFLAVSAAIGAGLSFYVFNGVW